MLQTRWQAARLLRRPCICQFRGYVDVGPPNPTDPKRGNAEAKLAHEPAIVCYRSCGTLGAARADNILGT